MSFVAYKKNSKDVVFTVIRRLLVSGVCYGLGGIG
jgi:hypothetical protein